MRGTGYDSRKFRNVDYIATLMSVRTVDSITDVSKSSELGISLRRINVKNVSVYNTV